MGGAPPLPLDFTPQGAQKGHFWPIFGVPRIPPGGGSGDSGGPGGPKKANIRAPGAPPDPPKWGSGGPFLGVRGPPGTDFRPILALQTPKSGPFWPPEPPSGTYQWGSWGRTGGWGALRGPTRPGIVRAALVPSAASLPARLLLTMGEMSGRRPPSDDRGDRLLGAG